VALLAVVPAPPAASQLPSPAASQLPSGVVVDPESPAGVEYAIPLDRARREAGAGSGAGGGPGSRRAGGEESLFGAGITRQRDGAGEGTSREGRSGAGGAASGDRTASEGAGPGEPRSAALASTAPDSGTGETVAIALAVLALGGLLGIALRRVLRSP
jgi:hypothetical protein